MTPESLATSTCRTPQLAAKQSDFVAQLEAANLHPLWDRFRTLTPVKPQAKDPPLIWRWRDIEPFTERAVREVPIDDVERRALILVNPAFGGETVTTLNLIAAFTVLDPGDRARPHRHTFAAIRFATRADGAATIVNGRRCEMQVGRPDPHAADVLARPHQRERPPHHLVRRRQHPADPPARRQFLRAGRSQGQPVLAGRRGRREAVGRGRHGRRRRGARAGAFAEVPLLRRGDPAAAGRPARRTRRRAHHALHQSRDRRRGDAGARLLCGATAQGRRPPGRSAPPAT